MEYSKVDGCNNIAIHVIPPDGEEDDEFSAPAQEAPRVRLRRKLSSPLSALPADNLLAINNVRRSAGRSLSALDRTTRRFSTMVSSAAAAAVSRRLSATIGWCLASPTQVKPHIVRQGRALCLQYIKSQIRRSTITTKKLVMKRLQRMIETECGEDAVSNVESGALAALRMLCCALERKRPDAFRHVARQATRAPAAMLRSDTALAELALALARRITNDNITWSKMAAVFCVCGALAREAAEAAGGEPSTELVAAPAAALADLLHEEPGGWVAAHGGWNGLIERLRASERDQRSERTLRVMISVFVIICLTLLLLRWVIHAHPSYY
ncbi:hypothetical protein JYU34_002578 [Plutella xylostella]|uniref:Uncharacterized protein n=2 Tax=Plutella xylostella TaxID=51655 RepID=A0ABQ7R2M2_PLUXY|nr:uncharacterized protein LOC105386177 [Plutella xylostella]KAG7311531.1 hypothetical protein JYU34_002578 [Plutella xylostella]CAG9099259.1 unnamed protein product [Plutella xylostella]